MALDKLQVINEALSLARGNTIQSLSETGSNSANVAEIHYDSVVQDLFSRYPFSFALSKERLNQTTEPLNEWRYAYLIPTEALYIRAVFEGSDSTENSLYARPTTDFDIGLQGDERVVYSNSRRLLAEYVKQVDPALWSPAFRELVVYALAAKIAFPLTSDKELQTILYQEAFGTPSQNGKGGRFYTARQQDVMQKPATQTATSPLIDARFGGYYGGY